MLVGCSSRTDPDSAIASVNETNLQRLANLYFTYQSKHEWRGPANEAEFKSFLRKYNPAKLTRIGIDPNAIDGLFISERDGEPFKIRYGVVGSAMGCSEPVIFESTGDGKTPRRLPQHATTRSRRDRIQLPLVCHRIPCAPARKSVTATVVRSRTCTPFATVMTAVITRLPLALRSRFATKVRSITDNRQFCYQQCDATVSVVSGIIDRVGESLGVLNNRRRELPPG